MIYLKYHLLVALIGHILSLIAGTLNLQITDILLKMTTFNKFVKLKNISFQKIQTY